MNENQDLKKVFVGNVPFQCTEEQFKDCFKDQEGYVDSKIIKRVGSNLSRGFGYIEFSTEDQANHFIENCGNIQLKERDLRFSIFHHKNIISKDNFNTDLKMSHYKIFVDDLSEDTSKEDIQDAFSEFKDIVSCFVNTSKKTDSSKKTGVVIFSSLESCKKALEDPPLLTSSGEQLTVKPFKLFNNLTTTITDVRKSHREGYKAGYIVGFQKGLIKGLSQPNQNIQATTKN